jgi:hypothetical protein
VEAVPDGGKACVNSNKLQELAEVLENSKSPRHWVRVLMIVPGPPGRRSGSVGAPEVDGRRTSPPATGSATYPKSRPVHSRLWPRRRTGKVALSAVFNPMPRMPPATIGDPNLCASSTAGSFAVGNFATLCAVAR